jgi:hypothetical protein
MAANMMKMTHVLGVSLAVLLAATTRAEAGAIVADRTALNALLGASAVNENFEAFRVADGTEQGVGTSLDSTSVVSGQGPGLVVPGFELVDIAAGSQLEWQGNNYFNLPTKTIGTSTSLGLVVRFTGFVTAVGMDVLAYGGYPNHTTVTVFATDDTTVLDTIGPIFGSGNTPIVPGFAGYFDADGIGQLLVTIPQGEFGPVIDNLEFGHVPEPGTFALVGLALAGMGLAKRRKLN